MPQAPPSNPVYGYNKHLQSVCQTDTLSNFSMEQLTYCRACLRAQISIRSCLTLSCRLITFQSFSVIILTDKDGTSNTSACRYSAAETSYFPKVNFSGSEIIWPKVQLTPIWCIFYVSWLCPRICSDQRPFFSHMAAVEKQCSCMDLRLQANSLFLMNWSQLCVFCLPNMPSFRQGEKNV